MGKIKSSLIRSALALALLVFPLAACLENQDPNHHHRQTIVVNSLLDSAAPPAGVVTLRSAIANLRPGGRIVFDPALNAGVIALTVVGEEHSILPAETYESNLFVGYTDKDHGPSALYTAADLTIDASSLPDGITLKWDGAVPARVLAVYGDLVLRHVTITGGHAVAVATGDTAQPWTLARGGGIAVWGIAHVERCTISGNRTEGDADPARDRGSFGGGIYGNLLLISDSVISGNWAKGYGAAGGGVYSVGGADLGQAESRLERCAVTGNRTTAQHSYGGGVFSGGGGPGNNLRMTLVNTTIARNLVEDNPDIAAAPGPPPPQFYYRGGGFYMTNGSVAVTSCTITENVVNGETATFSGKPNAGGGGMAATIGSAHVVENMEIQHSIIAGNLVNGAADDVYSGSLLYFYSYGYNVIGRINFDQILVPIPPWWSLSRKHYPKQGDADGVSPAQALDLVAVEKHPTIISQGADAGGNAVLWYPPGPAARNLIPAGYPETFVLAQYQTLPGRTDDFLSWVVEKLRTDFGLGPGFGAALVYSGVTWIGDDSTWTSDPANAAWIKFWRDLDVEIGSSLGTVKLGDDFWGSYSTGPVGANLSITVSHAARTVRLIDRDQLGTPRPADGSGDSGAIEKP